ncbi:hypothetical protein Arub01_20870 [Actinomadura rubrobrunea]|uniref:CAAX prenyl protease 2/Lysostaphin resistance protein A-like domain-containing protein n=1 Tax=Actinomadura rubrobrunea TaxID=115335 RepID=A0A9W6UVE0_9ACTN|nr:hypothetical protein Arub01_20870 [Actinomadura rubrobrunea]
MPPRPAPAVIGRAALGMLVMAVALGTASAVDDAARRLGLDGTGRRLLTAAVCCAIAVPLILFLRRRVDRLPLDGLGLTGRAESVRAFATGVLITAGSAAAVFGLGTAAGWVRWGPLDAPRLIAYVAVNAVIALALEALPEELTLRGYAYRTLNARFRRRTAFVGTVALFLVTPGAATVVQAAVSALLGGPVARPGLAPQGEDPVSYLILLAVFGSALLTARITTGSLWSAIGLHLAFLTVNRVTLYGEDRDAGWSAELTTPDAVLLVPGYLLLAAAVFRLIGRRIGWRERAPERPPRGQVLLSSPCCHGE